jgi:predicted RNase H-like HicB family nuclease
MQFHIFIQNPAENHFTATVIGMPDWAATGTTEAEALRKVEALLNEKLATGKIVTIEVQPITNGHAHKPNPLMQCAGMFTDDPYADELVAEMKREREIEDLI